VQRQRGTFPSRQASKNSRFVAVERATVSLLTVSVITKVPYSPTVIDEHAFPQRKIVDFAISAN
jgi:hypothetical protein